MRELRQRVRTKSWYLLLAAFAGFIVIDSVLFYIAQGGFFHYCADGARYAAIINGRYAP